PATVRGSALAVVLARGLRRGRRRSGASRRTERPAYRRGNFRTEELDRAQDVRVGHGTHGELQEEAVVAEQLVLEEDLVDDLGRAADEVRSAQPPLGVELRARGGRPATLAADPAHRLREGAPGEVGGTVAVLGEEPVRVDAQAEVAGVVAGTAPRLAVEV